MKYQELQKEAHIYSGALLLDDISTARTRRILFMWCATLAAVCFVGAAIAGVFLQESFGEYAHFFTGGALLFGALTITLALLRAFYNSYFFLDIKPTVAERGMGVDVPLEYEVARILNKPQLDATLALVTSPFGQLVIMRLGLSANSIEEYFAKRAEAPDTATLVFDESEVTVKEFAEQVYKNDAAFAAHLFSLDIEENDFLGASNWMSSVLEREKRASRWWGRESLGHIPGFGREWSYGQIHTLSKFSSELHASDSASTADKKEIDQLENILARERGSNALLVADSGSGEMDIVYGLVGRIQGGTVLPPLSGKRVLQFEAGALIDAAGGKKTTFESAFSSILSEATRAGNIILFFEDLPALMENARSIGSDLASLLAPYLNASNIDIIAFADKARYHESIERSTTLSNGFEILRVGEKDERLLISILENEVLRVEEESGVFFTFQAVEALASGVVRYFADRIPLDKARDLLQELPTATKRSGKSIVTRGDVQSIIAGKTGVPQEGAVTAPEKEKLLNLETKLHARVVGQDEAVTSIANSMRRARAGLRNPNRPIGSFLFLGPTGVGKTETAKALEEVFFGDEVPMLRLDMSEYSGQDALERLLGSFEGGKSGTLTTMLRDQQYGVLLLDEFEKASDAVHNLFLQVLDEGMFSDMLGKKVNARNTIIIATSNAGSDLIFKLVSEGKDLAKEKDAFIARLIESDTFRPELINRFDGVILFHPLGKEHLAEIAKLMVDHLAVRLAVQGLKLTVTPQLIAYLIRNGYDEKFGARSMNRVLQEKVEMLLAEKLIKGDLQRGSTVELMSKPETPDVLEIHTL